jgi:AraC-like DNA-binding protein
MQFEARFDIFAVFMLLGLSQGIFLISYYLNKRNRQDQANLFYGMLMIVFVILNSEILLNYSGFIVKVIYIENYSEPFIFLVMPLLYLIVKSKLMEKYTAEDHVHFFPFVFYFLYCFLYFLQSPEFKHNSYVYCYQPDWATLPVTMVLPEDPLGLRRSLPPLYLSQAFVYLYLIVIRLKCHPAKEPFRFFGKKDTEIKLLFQYWVHALIIVLLITFIKIHFERDLGDYLIGTYISIIMYISGYVVISKQIGTHYKKEDAQNNKPKYEKSSLSEERKEEVLKKLTELLEQKKYFTKNTISLADIAKSINEQPHHVSQVINEKLDKNFFDLLSYYRIEEAKRILKQESSQNLTIEEIAEQVGYNSKAAFNKAFKESTRMTPSEYKRQI